MSNPRTQALRSLLIGGILPVVAFTLVEEYFGTLWGLVAGMGLGVGEIIYEYVTNRKVDAITWIGNGLLVGLGLISLFTNEGIFFKLQPAILEAATAVLMIGSFVVKKPFLVLMAKKQGTFNSVDERMRGHLERFMDGLTFRIGIFFLLHAMLATWAALHWSTTAWAFLKGIGFTGSLILYMGVEMILMRRRTGAGGGAAIRITELADCMHVLPQLQAWGGAGALIDERRPRGLPATLVAMMGATPIGYVTLVENRADISYRIGALYVDGPFRGRGIETALGDAIGQKARALGISTVKSS